ncbi:unnamed protein product, partial [Durusdinium trenchii]
REAMLGIRKALDEEVARIRKAEEEDGAYLALLDQQGDYMRELERANSRKDEGGGPGPEARKERAWLPAFSTPLKKPLKIQDFKRVMLTDDGKLKPIRRAPDSA